MHSEARLYPVAPVPATTTRGVAPIFFPPQEQRLLRPLPMNTAGEPAWKRGLFVLVALAITGAYGFFLDSYWAPAPGRPGIDENAYLLGARNLAMNATTGFKPADDFQYVGAMWVRTTEQTISPPAFLPHFLAAHTKEGWYYPKYPAGLPLLNAVLIRIGGAEWAFALSPICMCLAVLGIFFLGQTVAGSFGGVLAMIALATNGTALELADLPNSHAASVCFVIWGMYFLIRWWQTGRWWTGGAAGFLLGYAVTIRYTEALLLFPLYPLDQIFLSANFNVDLHPRWWPVIKAVRFLPLGPLGLAVLLSIRWRSIRSYLAAAVPIISWMVPVAALVIFNWFSMGHVTGYDTTHESTGFSVQEFLSKWDFTLHELYLFGLFLLMPLGAAGLILLFRGRWRIALLLTAWLVPGALLYTAYYWGIETPGVGFLRFFLTLFPPLIVAAVWLLNSASIGANFDRRGGSIAGPLAAGLLTFGTAAVGLATGLPDLERQHRGNMNLHTSAQHITAKLNSPDRKAGRPIVFADEGMFPELLQYMQFMINGDWYAYDAYKIRPAGGMGLLGALELNNTDGHAPVLLQRERLEYMAKVLNGKTEHDLITAQHQLIDQAIADRRPIFAVLTSVEEIDFRRQFITAGYKLTEVDHWTEPCNVRFTHDDAAEGSALSREKSPLTPAVQSGEPWIRWAPQALKMFAIDKTSATPVR